MNLKIASDFVMSQWLCYEGNGIEIEFVARDK